MASEYASLYSPDYRTEKVDPFAFGRFGKVYLGYRKDDTQKTQKFAIKVQKNNISRRSAIKNEIAIMKKIEENDNIVKLINVFTDTREAILVLEFCGGGELLDVLEKQENERFTEECVARYAYQLLNALYFTHKAGIVHLDLKPENILCSEDASVLKITDFGLSLDVSDPEVDVRAMQGTPDYMSPEQINFERITQKTDMWSIGVIIYMLLSGLLPFGGDTDQETMCSITIGEYTFEYDEFSCVSEIAKIMVEKLLQKKPAERPAVENCMHDEFIETNFRTKKTSRPDRRLSVSVRQNIVKYNAARKWRKGINKVRAMCNLAGGLGAGSIMKLGNLKEVSGGAAPAKTANEAIKRLSQIDSRVLGSMIREENEKSGEKEESSENSEFPVLQE